MHANAKSFLSNFVLKIFENLWGRGEKISFLVKLFFNTLNKNLIGKERNFVKLKMRTADQLMYVLST